MTDYLFCHYTQPHFTQPNVYDLLCGVERIGIHKCGDSMALAIGSKPLRAYWHVDTKEYYMLVDGVFDVFAPKIKDEIYGRDNLDGVQEFILLSWNKTDKLVHVYEGVEKC